MRASKARLFEFLNNGKSRSLDESAQFRPAQDHRHGVAWNCFAHYTVADLEGGIVGNVRDHRAVFTTGILYRNRSQSGGRRNDGEDKNAHRLMA